MKRLLLFLLLFLPVLSGWPPPAVCFAGMNEIQTHYLRAEVKQILSENITGQGVNLPVGNQVFTVEITDAPFLGSVYTVENNCVGDPSFSYWVAEGARVVVALQTQQGKAISCSVDDYARDNHLAYLVLFFVLVLVIVGRKQGAKAIVSLSITLLIIAAFMLPRFLEGDDPVLLAILSSVMITAITVLLIGGISVKSISAILGTAIGLTAAAAISTYFGRLTNLRGVREEDLQLLLTVPQTLQLNLNGILFAGIIIGAVGAIMDVSMSIASSMDEINRAGRMGIAQLIKAGMNVGSDVMGTMSNTLILAYVGTSLPLLIYYMSSKPPLVQLMNSNYLASEFIRALSGSIGLILAIPVTALISGLLLNPRRTAADDGRLSRRARLR